MDLSEHRYRVLGLPQKRTRSEDSQSTYYSKRLNIETWLTTADTPIRSIELNASDIPVSPPSDMASTNQSPSDSRRPSTSSPTRTDKRTLSANDSSAQFAECLAQVFVFDANQESKAPHPSNWDDLLRQLGSFRDTPELSGEDYQDLQQLLVSETRSEEQANRRMSGYFLKDNKWTLRRDPNLVILDNTQWTRTASITGAL